MASAPALRKEAPELPSKVEDWTRYLKAERTLNDLVEDIHRILIEDKEYRAFLRATYDEHAVEGSLAADNIMAAEMIRDKATEIGSELIHEKLATISKALGVVLRRYHASRKERRQTVGGEVVPTNENND